MACEVQQSKPFFLPMFSASNGLLSVHLAQLFCNLKAHARSAPAQYAMDKQAVCSAMHGNSQALVRAGSDIVEHPTSGDKELIRAAASSSDPDVAIESISAPLSLP